MASEVIAAPPPPPPPPPSGAPTSSQEPSNGAAPPPPPPPPMPPAIGGKIPTWREEQEARKREQQQQARMESDQYSNLPPQLMNSMNKDKKPFTYTPLAVGDKGKLDLGQIKSPRMRKRLMANMKEEEDAELNGTARPTSESPCSLDASPSPAPGYDRSMTPEPAAQSTNRSEPMRPKVFKLPQPSKIDFTKELLERQKNLQIPAYITSTNELPTEPANQLSTTTSLPSYSTNTFQPNTQINQPHQMIQNTMNTAYSTLPANKPIYQPNYSANSSSNPMSPVELEAAVDNEIVGLHNALHGDNRPVPDYSSMTLKNMHPLRNVKPPSAEALTRYQSDRGYQSGQEDYSIHSRYQPDLRYDRSQSYDPYNRSYNEVAPKVKTIPVYIENNNNDYQTHLSRKGYSSDRPNISQQQNLEQPQPPLREYFNIQPPSKINLLESNNQTSYSEPQRKPFLGPSLGEQWAERKHQFQYKPYADQQPYYEPYQYNQTSVPAARSAPPRTYSKPKPVNVVYDEERPAPTQSRSFKVLQKLTEGIEDELQNLQLQEQLLHQQIPGYDDGWQRTTPRQSERNSQQSSNTMPQGYRTISGYKQLRNSMADDLYYDHSFNPARNQRIPASQQEQTRVPSKYMGSSIPSQSFRVLQMITGTETYNRSVPTQGTDF